MSAPALETFTPGDFAATWLDAPASVASYKQHAYGIPEDETEDFLKTGVWAPSLPVAQLIPDFHGDPAAGTDAPDYNRMMGRKVKYTRGTFSGLLHVRTPEVHRVVVLDGYEGRKMHIEFIIQRCKRMPKHFVYDFSCATLKKALCPLPWIAHAIAFLVDRFHWRKNHVSCSKAMNPDSCDVMGGVNTSSSAERNTLYRRQEHHLRLMMQENFIIFTTYQQALCNAIAMYQDIGTEVTPSRWPWWYSEKFLDGVGNS